MYELPGEIDASASKPSIPYAYFQTILTREGLGVLPILVLYVAGMYSMTDIGNAIGKHKSVVSSKTRNLIKLGLLQWHTPSLHGEDFPVPADQASLVLSGLRFRLKPAFSKC
ncbi:hypothetical protein [Marinobacterium weihaiense]|uniref:MarR family transcriptional regulator n=1 Tax=Marinobacterium weihaiense TaxID=2851016 RepID=A0ABS6MF41_9GAMM|nr:hypothetical protein [Marinobacterium weihaiense]MBV0934917.1 hypothetical protein [Marinobacterium weihaiense]